MQQPDSIPAIAPVQGITPRLLSIADAVRYTATSRAKLYLENKAGRLDFVKLDGATRLEVAELDRWIDSKMNDRAAA